MKVEEVKMISFKWLSKQARTRLARALVAALPVTLAACGAAQPSDPIISSGGGASTGLTNSCVPISQQIPFTFSGGALEIAYYYGFISGGAVPATQFSAAGTFGVVRVGGAATGGTYSGDGGTYNASRLSMGISNLTATDAFAPVTTSNAAAGTGIITIDASTQQLIAYSVQIGEVQIPGLSATTTTTAWGSTSGMAYPGTAAISAAQICVSGVAFDLNIEGTNLEGDVFLYLNNTTHGIVIPF